MDKIDQAVERAMKQITDELDKLKERLMEGADSLNGQMDALGKQIDDLATGIDSLGNQIRKRF